MNPLTILLASRRSVTLCWLLVLVATLCAPCSQVHAAFTNPALRAATALDDGWNAGGTRDGQGAVQGGDDATLSTNDLDQVTGRLLADRGFGLLGFANKDAKVLVLNPTLPAWRELSVDSQTGGFFGWWSVPANYGGGNGTSVARIPSRVRGVIPPKVPGSVPLVAEVDVSVVVPPVSESLTYNSAGQLESDAFWTYHWVNNAGVSFRFAVCP